MGTTKKRFMKMVVVQGRRLVFACGCLWLSLTAQAQPAKPGSLANVQYATLFTGSDAGAQVHACLLAATAPAGSGVCDARGLPAETTFGSNVFAGMTRPFTLLLPFGTISVKTTQIVSVPNSRIIGPQRAQTTLLWKGAPGGTILDTSTVSSMELGDLTLQCHGKAAIGWLAGGGSANTFEDRAKRVRAIGCTSSAFSGYDPGVSNYGLNTAYIEEPYIMSSKTDMRMLFGQAVMVGGTLSTSGTANLEAANNAVIESYGTIYSSNPPQAGSNILFATTRTGYGRYEGFGNWFEGSSSNVVSAAPGGGCGELRLWGGHIASPSTSSLMDFANWTCGTPLLIGNYIIGNGSTQITVPAGVTLKVAYPMGKALTFNGLGNVDYFDGESITLHGGNRSFTITPSGAGNTILNGDVGIGTTHPSVKLDVAGSLRSEPIAFASAPACDLKTEGSLQAISDSAVNSWGAAIRGGGAQHVLAYCDGKRWTVMAK